MDKLKKGMIVRTSDNFVCIVLEVTKKDIKRGVNADKPGLYGFRGFWYGSNVHKIKSFGKIEYLDDNYTIIHKNTFGLKNKYLKTIL